MNRRMPRPTPPKRLLVDLHAEDHQEQHLKLDTAYATLEIAIAEVMAAQDFSCWH